MVATTDDTGRVLSVALVNPCRRAVTLTVGVLGQRRTLTIRPRSNRTIDVAALAAQPIHLDALGLSIAASGA